MLVNIFAVFINPIKIYLHTHEKEIRTQDGYLCKIQLEQPQISLSVRLCVKEKHWKCPQSMVHGPLVFCPDFRNEKPCHLITESQKIVANFIC